MVAISDFYDDVLDDLDRCTSSSADKGIRQAAIEFCRETECWQYDHDDLLVVANIAELDISLPTGSRLRRITNMVNSDGDPIVEQDDKWLDENVSNWRTEQSDTFKYFNQAGQIVRIVAVPLTTALNAITGIRMVLVPTQDATDIGDVLYDDHKDAICDGAKYRLMSQKGKPWSDPAAAKDAHARFVAAMRDARWQANKGFSGGTLAITGANYTGPASRSQKWYEEDL